MTVPSYNPNKITDTPPRGQCWVCDENNIPVEDQLRIPAICSSEECWEAWVRMMNVGTSHVAQPQVPEVGAA